MHSSSAPSEPTEALSVGVATPAMMEPSTATISASGGTRAMTMRLPSPARSSRVIGTAGAAAGFSSARITTHSA